MAIIAKFTLHNNVLIVSAHSNQWFGIFYSIKYEHECSLRTDTVKSRFVNQNINCTDYIFEFVDVKWAIISSRLLAECGCKGCENVTKCKNQNMTEYE